MIYMEIARLRLIRSRDLIFLKFKRNILSNPQFSPILVVIKVLCMVGFWFFRFIEMYDIKVENGIPSIFRYFLSGMSKSFYWMKPLYVIDEPITRLYQSPEERRLRNTEAQRERRKKMSSVDKNKMNSQDRERWCDRGPRVNEAKRLKRSLEPIRLFESSSQETCFKQIIHRVKMSAAKMLHATNMDLTNKTNTTHKSLVCLVCDCFIMGTFKKVPSMSISDIKRHSHRLSVKRYEEFYGEALHKDLVAQYHVPGFPGMLLSKRARKVGCGLYSVCTHCKTGLKACSVASKHPPKFAIANGFAIGSFPSKIPYSSPDKGCTLRNIDVMHDVNDVMKALIAPVRPFGYVFQHFGGSQKCIQGHYQFFETDQQCVTGAFNFLNEQNVNNIFVMICGTTTPRQKSAILAKTAVDIELFKDLRTWFIENSVCAAFKDAPLPNNVEAIMPTIIQDSQNNDSAPEIDPDLETSFGDAQYFFSSAQDPDDETSVYETTRKFACALVNHSAPTVFVRGGNFGKEHELPIEAVLPFAFPYGLGGPKQKRATPISLKSCIQRYFRLAMPQFMTADVVLVLHQIFSRQISFETGVMTCRNQKSSNEFTKSLCQVSPKDFEEASKNTEQPANSNVENIVRSITTKCKSLGHTAEAAQDARKRQFAMMDHFGLNSLFLTITPDDECSFRVRLYANPDNEVS
jgi:hypothetical protein